MEVTGDIALFLAATVLGAIVLVLHVLVVWLAIRPRADAGWVWRLLAVFVPPLAPIVAWRVGRRVAAVLWVAAVVAYATVRVVYARFPA